MDLAHHLLCRHLQPRQSIPLYVHVPTAAYLSSDDSPASGRVLSYTLPHVLSPIQILVQMNVQIPSAHLAF